MILNEITIILGTITLLLAVIAPFFSPFYRFRTILKQLSVHASDSEQPTIANSTPEADDPSKTAETTTSHPVSILLTVHNQAKELEEHLPALLAQAFSSEYQIIVVAEQGDSVTEDVLKRYAHEPRLYATFIPSSSRYMSRKKLAITIGVKAAKYEWIIMTDANCAPSSPYWLQIMADACTQERQLVMGYSNFASETADFRQIEQLHTELYLMRKAYQGTAYRTNAANLAFRKSMFIREEGYRGNLQLLRGEYDFMVNKYAEKGNTQIVIDRRAWTIEDNPCHKAWTNKHIFYQETRRHLNRSGVMRVRFNLDMAWLHISFLAIIAVAVYSSLSALYILTALSALAFILTLALRMLFARKPMAYFLGDVSLWKVVPFELCLIWRKLSYQLKYKKADKNDFTSHKL